ncbi:MAG: hypothetical protein JW818_19805 [Pirellulales bacterium]|nr:hypothetical protein [Pirellulales bacterium]
MGPDEMRHLDAALFPDAPSQIAADYLAFLAARVPKDIAEQLDTDGQPDIGMPHQTVTIEDLLAPLSSGVFPTENLYGLADLLGFIVIGYNTLIDENEGNLAPYKMLYGASLYLYCFLGNDREPSASGYPCATRVIISVSAALDVPSRLQVCRFLASLVPMVPANETDEPDWETPRSVLLLTLAMIVGGILSDLGVLAEHAMESEHLHQEWNDCDSLSGVSDMKKALLEMFGMSRGVREAADRLLAATQNGDSNNCENGER